MQQLPAQTVGLGLRHEISDDLKKYSEKPIDFIEFAPENWLTIGGERRKELEYFTERYPVVCHGLSLSIGGLTPLDMEFLKKLKIFFNRYQVKIYSEHLSFCNDEQGMLYDLFPIPFTEEAVHHAAKRIKIVQDILERRIAIENISYYCPLTTELTESEFINHVLIEANCDLLLDVNNIYVNSINHSYDAKKFLLSLPKNRVAYLHIAGHDEQDDFILDSHGADVIDPVWNLLKTAYQHCGIRPTLLERDNNVPSLKKLLKEVAQIRKIQNGDV